MPRSLIVLCLAAALVVAMLGCGWADVGARALAMGGAYVGLADDASATFWNPAALAFMTEPGVMYSAALNNRNNLAFRDFATYVTPFDENSTVGLSYTKALVKSLTEYDNDTGENDLAFNWEETWYWFSYGAKLSSTAAWGFNARWIKADANLEIAGVPVPVKVDSAYAVDLGVYQWITKNISAGLLVQNLVEPKRDEEILGVDFNPKEPRVFRPGVAMRWPERGLIATAEVCDVTDAVDRGVRVGLEKTVARPAYDLALRAGYNGNGHALTAGAGVKYNGWSLDFAILGGDFDNTWYASLTGGF